MTKIALTTKYSAFNFGAMLQTFALQKKLIQLGAECIVVDADRKKPQGLQSWKSLSGMVNNLFYLLHKDELETGYKRFHDFMVSLPLTREYKSYSELKEFSPDADIFLSGSDQVWNPLDVREEYFLRYAPADKVRASYAASMGVSYMPDGARRIWSEYLEDIDYLSVREDTARELIAEISKRNAEVHIDPVLLLSEEEWAKEATPVNYKNGYILCYILYRPMWLNSWLKKLHKETGKEIVVISSDAYRNIYHTKFVRDAGPRELLGWLRNADFVISSSFHGVALSIANRKPFYAVVNSGAPARISDLLKTFQLSDRIIEENSKTDLKELDYEMASKIQTEQIQKASEYLAFLIRKPEKVKKKDSKRVEHCGSVELIGEKCTGCTVCSYVCPTKAISMQDNGEGFFYPKIDPEKCIHCNKCLRSCHTIG